MTTEEQLEQWLKGNPVHMGERPNGKCCPDFSCCRPDLLSDKETRQIYYDAFKNKQTEVYESMLMGFLGQLLSDKKVYIAGRADGGIS